MNFIYCHMKVDEVTNKGLFWCVTSPTLSKYQKYDVNEILMFNVTELPLIYLLNRILF